MVLGKSSVCRSCKSLDTAYACEFGEVTAPNDKSECWYYRHKAETLNIATRSGESAIQRLKGTWMSDKTNG